MTEEFNVVVDRNNLELELETISTLVLDVQDELAERKREADQAKNQLEFIR